MPLEYDGDWVWALDDAFSVYLAYLADALVTSPATDEAWVQELVVSLQRSSVLSDHSMIFEPASQEQRSLIRRAVGRARDAAVAGGDVSREALRRWTFEAFDGWPVSGGFSRTGEVVELSRVLEVADALEGMMDGTMPTRPAYHRWFVGTDAGWATIEMTEP